MRTLSTGRITWLEIAVLNNTSNESACVLCSIMCIPKLLNYMNEGAFGRH
jgi:hypothetical protein